MPLLGRVAPLCVGTLFLGGLLGGCFEEPGSAVSSDTDTSNDSSSAGAETGSVPTSGPDDDDGGGVGGGCMGCLDMQGACLPGNNDQACGVLAAACVVCGDGMLCDDGACAPEPQCTADNCAGCCDGDTCIEELSNSACGVDGQQCSVCMGDSVCEGGVCDLPCADTCDGCCDATGDCIPLDATSNAACGEQGAACAPCGDDFSCESGTCVSTECLDTCPGCCDGSICQDGTSDSACGGSGSACEQCPAGTECTDECTARDDAVWSVLIESADIPMDGTVWDTIGTTPDPFVVVTLADDTSGETATIDNSYMPIWDEVVLSGVETALLMSINIVVRDADNFSSEVMGDCTFSIPDHNFGVPLAAECVNDDDSLAWTLYLRFTAD